MLGWAAVFLLQIVSAITYLSGTILNVIIKFTVVQMKSGVEAAGIDSAWAVIRDVANMGFIFILLYAAIMTIIGKGQDNKQLIVNTVVAAILVNFSLFFTKLIVDAANMLAMLFYGAMVPASALSTDPSTLFEKTGLANSLMEPLKIQSIWQAAGNITGTQLLLIGVLGSVFALIAAFVFFAVSIMFVIRFVVLLFVMVLSPIVFLASILPLTKKYRDQWWETLSGQAFFAPIYFFLTWVVLYISQQLAGRLGTADLSTALVGTASTKTIEGGATMLAMTPPAPETIGVVINFMIIITLLVTSLVIAKEWANKAGGGVSKLTSWATGLAGGATMGMAGRFGRGTLGAAGSALGDSEKLKSAAAKGGATGMAARLALVASRKTAGASFDFRGTGLGGTLDAGKAQKGGYAEDLKKSAERKKKFGESLKPSDIVMDEADQTLENIKETDENSAEFREKWTTERQKQREKLEKMVERRNISTDAGERQELTKQIIVAKTSYDAISTAREYKERLKKEAQKRVDELKGVDDDRAKEIIKSDYDPAKNEGISYKQYIAGDVGKAHIAALKKTNKSAAERRKEAEAQHLKDPRLVRKWWNPNLIITRSSKQAAAELRKGKKPVKDQLEAILKEAGEIKKDEEKGTEPPETEVGGKSEKPKTTT